jgi:hypothetical protein
MGIAIVILYLFALLLLSLLERYADWRDRRWLSRAAAMQFGAVDIDIPITAVEPEPPLRTTYDVRCEGVKPPWFVSSERLASRRDWGMN